MRYTFLFAATLGLLLFGLPASSLAQLRVVGQVIDNKTLVPIAAARVQVFDRRGDKITDRVADEAGTFEFTPSGHGGYRFRASRIGYEAAETPVLWTDGYDHIRVEIRLDADAILLAPIEIVARSRVHPSPVLAGFRDRLESDVGGHFFTRGDIERLHPVYVSDVIAMVPGVRLESSRYGNRRAISMTRSFANGDCPAQIFVDGFLLNRRSPVTGEGYGFTVDDAVSPGSVEGIEVYKGSSTVPAEFLNPYSHCGVVAIWTRRGG